MTQPRVPLSALPPAVSSGRRAGPRLLAVLGTATISLNAIFTKLAATSTATVVFYRCLISLVPLALLARTEIRAHGWPPARVVLAQALAGVCMGLDFALWTQSIELVGAGVATVLNNVQVIAVPVLAWLWARERVPRGFLVAGPVLLFGVALAGGALGADPSEGSNPLLGTLLGLASGVAYAGYIFIVGRTGRSTGASVQVLISTVLAGIVGTATGLAWGGLDLVPGWRALGWLVVLALGGQVLGWVMLGASIPKLPAELGASILTLQPALAVVLAMLLLHERPTPAQLVGCAIVIAVVAMVARMPARRHDPPA